MYMYSKFEKSLQKLEVLFKYSGMNLKHKILNKEDIIKYRWLYTFNFLWVLSATVASVYYIIIGITEGKNFIELTSVAPCLTFAILALFKSICHLIYENDIQELIILLKNLDGKVNEENYEQQRIINEDIDFLNIVINVLYILNCLMIAVFDVTPLMLMVVKYYKTNEFELLLPYLDVFTFLPYELKYWLLAYIHQMWSECVVLLEMGATDYLFFTCCTYIRSQFRLLKYDIERLIPFKDSEIQDVEAECTVQNKFVELVQWHQDLINSSKLLEAIYSKSTLLNFLSSSLVICLTGFNVTIVKDIEVMITFVTFLFMSLMQVFFLCFFADMLMSASVEVSNAIYNCYWYSARPDIVKQLFIVQTRAQKPCKLTAAGFADVNLRAFMRVLSKAWSYFALLQTMYSG